MWTTPGARLAHAGALAHAVRRLGLRGAHPADEAWDRRDPAPPPAGYIALKVFEQRRDVGRRVAHRGDRRDRQAREPVNGWPRMTVAVDSPVIQGFSGLRRRAGGCRRRCQWCPGPESNRHGVSPEGFSYSLQLSLLCPDPSTFGVWTLPLPYRIHLASRYDVGRGRQVSTLSRLNRGRRTRLSSGLQSP